MNRFQALARYLDELTERVEAVRNPQGHGVRLRLVHADGSVTEQCEVDRPWVTITNTFVEPPPHEDTPDSAAQTAPQQEYSKAEIEAARRCGIHLRNYR